MRQQISLEQNKLFQERAVNRNLDLWVGPTRAEWVAEALSFLGRALRSPGLEGKVQGRARLAASGFFRVRAWVPRPFSQPWPSPHLVKPAQLCFQTHTGLGKHPDFLQEPLEKGEKKGKKRVVLQVHTKGRATRECARTPLPFPAGPVPELWLPGSP